VTPGPEGLRGGGATPPGTIVAIHLCPGPRSRSVMRAVDRATALEELGLEGDRNARPGSERQVLLVEAEVLEALELVPGQIREQVTVRGLRLDDLEPGARLRAGSAEFAVAGPCDPCQRMNEIRPGLLDQLEGRRGRFVSVVRGGTIAIGDIFTAAPAD
jgi:MOSC domain-containing protein YiiM